MPMLMLIEALAALASEGLNVATRDPDAAREALAGVCPRPRRRITAYPREPAGGSRPFGAFPGGIPTG
jgi:hypothetical protein